MQELYSFGQLENPFACTYDVREFTEIYDVVLYVIKETKQSRGR